jgi:NAD(P)-dependent dehydrogenase (short-subunit alcohol dehydrogenase family)
MDLGDLRSVAAFVQAFRRQLGGAPLHALVNNAGANFMGRAPWHTAAGVAGIPQVELAMVVHVPLVWRLQWADVGPWARSCRVLRGGSLVRMSDTGHPGAMAVSVITRALRLRKLSLQVNVLGPFALTQQLRPLLRAAGAARVVTVASVMHRKAALPPNLDSFFTCASVEPHMRQSFADTVEQPYPCTASEANLQCSHLIDQWFSILHCRRDLEAVQLCLLTMGLAVANPECLWLNRKPGALPKAIRRCKPSAPATPCCCQCNHQKPVMLVLQRSVGLAMQLM